MLWLLRKVLHQRFSVIFRAESSSSRVILTEILDNMQGRNTELSKTYKMRTNLNYQSRKAQSLNCQDGNKNFVIDVIGNGSHASSKSAYITTDFFRGLFNCGEGTQRLSAEYKFKISKTHHIFITYPSWENVSGLLGVALSLQSVGIPELHIHGPKCIENIFAATNQFVALRWLHIKVIDAKTENEYTDGSIHIKAIPLHSSQKNDTHQAECPSSAVESNFVNDHSDLENDDVDDIDYYAHLGPQKRKKDESPEHNAKKSRTHSAENQSYKMYDMSKYAVAYICHSKATLGKLLTNKCVDLGVTPGPNLQRLKRGESITLPNGKIVRSEDVTMPNLPGAVVIAVECPTEDYLNSLLEEPAFFKHQSGDTDDIASVIIHFSSVSIVNNPKYQEWINRFPSSTKHLYLNEANKSFPSINVQRQQYKMNMIHPEIFPLLTDSGIPEYPRKMSELCTVGHSVVKVQEKKEENDKVKIHLKNLYEDFDKLGDLLDKVYFKCEDNPNIRGETLCKLQIRPIAAYDYSRSLVLKLDYFREEVYSSKDAVSELNALKETISSMTLSDRIYPKIVFLGTGSSQPSKLRNTTGILVFADEETPFILDCGEGTYYQMVQFFGKEKAWDILTKLNVIYVSHLHSDHHFGLIMLLKQRELAFKAKQALSPKDAKPFTPVKLLAPAQLSRWLLLFQKEFEAISHLYTLYPNGALIRPFSGNEKYEAYLKCLNMKEIKTTIVDHCQNAFGIAFTHQDGWKLTYSGDTRPCENLVELGMNSDVLIHEATLDDSMAKMAHRKLHSTSSQAILIGKQMNAKYILLTHFSQRYSHLPMFNDNFTEEVGVAFDNMMVSFNQLPILSKLKPAFIAVFSAYYKFMENRRDDYELKEKRYQILPTEDS